MIWNVTAAVIAVLLWGIITLEYGGLCILRNTDWLLVSTVFTNPEVRQKTRGFLLISAFLGLLYLILLQLLFDHGFPTIIGITIVVEVIVAISLFFWIILLASAVALTGYVHHR